MSANITEQGRGIKGVVLKKTRTFTDPRGSFTEVFRSSWAEGCNYQKEIQLNLSKSTKGSLRGLHFHHRQHDWWIPAAGEMQCALADLRQGSPTFMQVDVFRFSGDGNSCLLIPPGVAHGFCALSDMILMYAVDRFYNGSDEQGVAWDDPLLSICWEVQSPVLSGRDTSNPTVEKLKADGLLPLYSSQS
ncbi:dTDP-4-dehydrorhamnose 3,5-epimerase [Candidatus Fermentibacteria bacterium]|nr:MAG: dTDP-4-dehydrorhamnose 3,5-epimerase [Candidatus Fermentibacteria bacterium]